MCPRSTSIGTRSKGSIESSSVFAWLFPLSFRFWRPWLQQPHLADERFAAKAASLIDWMMGKVHRNQAKAAYQT